ncbi:unnamed protein product [Arabidopsis halleri]
MGFQITGFCLILLFFFYHLPCALSQQERSELCHSYSYQCGDITAFYPFWGENCVGKSDYPTLKLSCNKFSNTTTLTISGHNYSVLHIENYYREYFPRNYISTNLRLSRQDFSDPFCSASFNSTPFPSNLFKILPSYKSLTVFYACDPRRHFLGNFTCPVKGLGSVIQNSMYHKLCDESFSVTVPTSFVPEEEALNLTNLESVLRKGFEVKLTLSDGKITYLELPSILVVLVIMIRVVLFWEKRKPKSLRDENLDALVTLRRYSYGEIKKITKSFAQVVGRGGFGTVYKGMLHDGRKVAVKLLKDSKGNWEDFINEVASMSKTSHVNIVSLLGFCYEGSKRAIVYEFLENGSLDHSLSLDVSTLYRIALGVARGIEYLHFGCKTRIVHFDIKPQNVLLDENLRPKVADFGLAKLCENQESILSLLDTRGTIGYIAPELFSRVYGNVSHKSDVYSYGMLVLEMTGERNKERVQNADSNNSSAYFPDWIYKDLENFDNARLLGDGLTHEEKDIAKKMILVGLWCIQFCPSDRPSMSKVVEMMEGSLDSLNPPPKPLLHIPMQNIAESSQPSEEESSIYSEV